MNYFIYDSGQRGVMKHYGTRPADMVDAICEFENEEHVILAKQTDSWTVHVSGRFTPIGRIHVLDPLPAQPKPRHTEKLPKGDQPVAVTIELLFIPDNMNHIYFHLNEERETYAQRVTNLRSCVQKEMQSCLYEDGKLRGQFKVTTVDLDVDSYEWMKGVK